MDAFFSNYEEIVAMLLFGIGFTTLMFHRNLVKKIIGLNIMDTAVYLFLASMGYIEGGMAPIVPPEGATLLFMSTPFPPDLYSRASSFRSA